MELKTRDNRPFLREYMTTTVMDASGLEFTGIRNGDTVYIESMYFYDGTPREAVICKCPRLNNRIYMHRSRLFSMKKSFNELITY